MEKSFISQNIGSKKEVFGNLKISGNINISGIGSADPVLSWNITATLSIDGHEMVVGLASNNTTRTLQLAEGTIVTVKRTEGWYNTKGDRFEGRVLHLPNGEITIKANKTSLLTFSLLRSSI